MRKPDMVINHNYLKRWFVIPRNRFFNIYLHCFTGSDYDRALHDHPWWSLSILMKGELIEHTFNAKKTIPRWLPIIRSAKRAHRIELVRGPAWTIFITGPKIRPWGFYSKAGWLPWRLFCNMNNIPIIENKDVEK